MAETPSHLDADGRAHMVDVGEKAVTDRTARATATVCVQPETAAQVAKGGLSKGDVAAVARIAGIQAAKRTPELLPLCHHVALASVDVVVDVDTAAGTITMASTARAADRTGVEMEALTAASVAALTVYDMVKSVERGATITDVALEEKAGGRSGRWQRAPG
jgi:cyclic pyranopterin phosphate synthase